jgi:UDP-glucuronate decarboxylase
LDLAKTILQLARSKSEIVLKPLPQDDPTRRCPDITLAKSKLSWTPKVGFKDGLTKTIAYFEKFLKEGA